MSFSPQIQNGTVTNKQSGGLAIKMALAPALVLLIQSAADIGVEGWRNKAAPGASMGLLRLGAQEMQVAN